MFIKHFIYTNLIMHDVYIVNFISNFHCYIQSCYISNFWYVVFPIIFKIGLAQGFYSYGIKPCLVKQSFRF